MERASSTCAHLQTPDDLCRFTIVSLWEDHGEVGELRKYKDIDVRIRGLIQPMDGLAGMVLSHARQFNGGPPKFKPNPKLIPASALKRAARPSAIPTSARRAATAPL